MRRRRCVAAAAVVAAALLAPTGGHAPDANAAEPAAVLSSHLGRLTVRHGVVHESMVVLPIVLAAEPDAAERGGAGPAGGGGADEPAQPADPIQPPGSGVTWRPAANGVLSLVELAGSAGAAPVRRLVPGGSLLLGGDRERILAGPVPLLDAERAAAPSHVCDSRERPAEPAGVLRVGRLPPLEQRKLQLLGSYDALLPTLQRVQAYLARLPRSADTLTAVFEDPDVAAGERARMGSFAKVPGAYAGRTVGHIVHFGYRPVEAVVFATPADYRSMGPEYLRAASVSHVLWAEAMGAVARTATDDEVRRMAKDGASILRRLATARTQRVRSVAGERHRWTSRVGRTDGVSGRDDRTESFVCRMGLDDAGEFVFLEAYENGPSIAYAEPYREPGGRPVGEPPDDKGNGPLTPEAMERLYERIRERRERQEREAR